MLKQLRKNTKIIIWFIIISFCLWGAFSVGIQLSEKTQVAGTAFGKPVSFQEFDKFMKSTEIFSMTGSRIEDPQILEQQTWQNILFAREAKRLKIKVTDQEVLDELQRLLAEQKVPADSASYQAWVRAVSGQTPRNFEEMIRETLRIQKLLRTVQNEPVKDTLSETDLRKKYLLDKREIAGELLIFPDEVQSLAFEKSQNLHADWHDATSRPQNSRFENIALQSLSDIALSFGLSDDQVQTLYNLPSEIVSNRMETQSGRWIIFKVKSKKEVSETEWDAPGVSEKYRLEQLERQRYQVFLQWHNDLIQRAHFESYRQPL